MKLNKVAMLFAATLLAASSAQAQNWMSGQGASWRNTDQSLCWRGGAWTPATATKGCDGAIGSSAPAPVPAPQATPAPAPAPASAPAPAKTAPAAVVAPPAVVKVVYAADTFFDTAKSVIKADGKAMLDDLSSKVKGLNLEVIIAVGHTDNTGTPKHNQGLSVRRADSVKAYLISKGIEKNRVYTEGKGETQPVADNKTKEGRAKNRRVDIEVVGTRAN